MKADRTFQLYRTKVAWGLVSTFNVWFYGCVMTGMNYDWIVTGILYDSNILSAQSSNQGLSGFPPVFWPKHSSPNS